MIFSGSPRLRQDSPLCSDPAPRDCGLDGALDRAHGLLLLMARRTLEKDHPRSEQMHPDEFPSSSSNPAAVDRTGSHSTHPRADATGVVDEEVLTYHEAALLLKV